MPGEPPLEIESVNKHYLDKVMDLAEEMDVEATEDIFDARGMKLLAKGAKISRDMQERLILHKLRKPLESTIAVEGGVNADSVINEARRIAESSSPVSCILRSMVKNGIAPLDVMASIELGSAMRMMLTVVEKGGTSALEHCVMVSLVSVCLANRMGLNEKDQKIVALAGLLHDIGELYIEPEYLKEKRRLLPNEWRHVVVHPRIGQMLIGELENYPPAVAIAVSEHHERFDGAGYPRRVGGRNISAAGQAVSVAEMISGVFMKRDRPLARAELALKIVPGEHPHNLVSAVATALRSAELNDDQSVSAEPAESMRIAHALSARIDSALNSGGSLLEGADSLSAKGKDMVSQALERVRTVQRAFISTGLDVCMNEGAAFFEGRNAQLLFEAAVGVKEIGWRLQDVARDLALQGSALESHDNDALQPLIALLDEE